MAPIALPIWLRRRIEVVRHGAKAVACYTLLPPVTETSAGIYLLEVDNTFELHAVADASNGIEGVTIPLSRREAFRLARTLFVSLAAARKKAEEAALEPRFTCAICGREHEEIDLSREVPNQCVSCTFGLPTPDRTRCPDCRTAKPSKLGDELWGADANPTGKPEAIPS